MGHQVLVPLLLLLLPLFQGASPRPPRPRSRRAAPLPPPANATIFSHVYNIRVPPCSACGDPQEAQGSTATAVPMGEPGMGEAEKQVVLTHRINLAGPGCGCEADTAALRDVLARLRALEAQVRSLRDQCSPTAAATTQAGTGQTDTRSLCSQHGTFDLSACSCVCEKGWGGPTCAEPQCPGGCGPAGVCVDGHCQVPTCPDDCNDQGRCLGGRCVCFEGYSGPACETPACPQGCRARGRCVAGLCVCHPGYSGPDCGTRACPRDCWGRGECRQGRCHCRPGYAGEDCALEIPSVDVRVVSREETSFRLEWRRPKTPVDGYEIRLVPMGNPQGVSLLQLPGSATVFAPSGLVPGQEFSVTVQALRDQHLGPPTTLTVGTRIDAPHGLRPTGTTPTSLSLRWDPPAAAPERYTLQYTPVSRVGRGPPSHLDLPPDRQHVTLSGLESDTRYRITLKAHRDREASPPAIVTAATASTAAPPPPMGPPPESTRPEASRTRPPAPAPPAVRSSPRPSFPDASPLSSHVFLRTVVQNITAKLSPYNGTFLQRLESYLRATGFPLRGNQTIPSVAQAIFFYLTRRKPVDIRDMVFSRLSEHTEGLADIAPTRAPSAFPLGREVGSIYSEGYSQLDGGRETHTKPRVVASSPGTVVISLDGLRGHADRMVIRYRQVGGQGGSAAEELSVPGDAATVRLPSLAPGATYQVEIHGVVKGRSSKSYSIIISTAPESSSPEEPTAPPVPSTTSPRQEESRAPGDLAVTDVTADRFRVTWTATTSIFQRFLLRYRDTSSRAPPGEIQVPGGQRSVVVTQLSPGTEYELELWGEGPGGTLSEPTVTRAMTAPQGGSPGPGVLGGLAVGNVTSDSFGLAWTVWQGLLDSFLVLSQDMAGQAGSQEVQVPGDQRATLIQGLQPATAYAVTLYGVHQGRLSRPLRANVSTAPADHPAKPTLGELSASDITHDSVRLSWTVPQGQFDSFTIQYRDTEGKPQALPVDRGSREVTVPSLVPSQRYKFHLYGISGQKRTGPISTDTITAPAPRREEERPAQPSLGELSASDITHDSVRLSWTVPQGQFDSFTIQYKDKEGKMQALPVDGGSRRVTIPNLVPFRRYKFNLYGISGRKRHGPISTDAVTARAPREEKPSAQPSLGELSASDITHDSVRLSWTVSQGQFDSFTIQYKDIEGKTQALPMDGGSRTVTVPNLTPSHQYKFNLYGVSGRKRHGPVSTDIVTGSVLQETEEATVAPAQLSLGELSATNITHDSVRLSWTVPQGQFDSFTIQYRDREGKPQALPVDGGSHTVTVLNLTPSQRYKFNLYGISGQKRHGPESTDIITAPAPQEDITPQLRLGALTADNVGPRALDLSWTVEEGIFDSFIIHYRDAAGQAQALPVDGVLRSLHLHDLTPSHQYRFNLYGISGRKRLGPISTNATTAPQEEEPLPQPRLGDLSYYDATHNSVLLSWTIQEGEFNSFLIEYQDAAGQPQSLPADGTHRSIRVGHLVPSHRYVFHLYGISAQRRFGPVSTDVVTAPESWKEKPHLGELSASDITPDSLRLSWTVQSGSFDSFLVQYKDAEGRPQTLTVDGGSRTVTVSSLVPSRKYKFNLYGVASRKRHGPVSTDAVTASALQEEEEEETTVAPAQPNLGELSASDVTHDSVRLSWTVPQGTFNSFTLQYRDIEGKLQALPMDGKHRTVSIPSLAPSHPYRFKLYGTSGKKRHGPISTDIITAPAPLEEEEVVTVAPAQPSLGELTASDITHDSVRLSWTVPQGQFDSFTVQYKDVEGKPQALPMDGGSRTITVPNLVPSRRYRFNLYGVSGRKRHGPISTEATTASVPQEEEEEEPTAAPAQPRLGELTASDIAHDSVRLSWTVPQGQFDSFTVQYKDAEGKPQALPVDGGSRAITVPNLVPSRRYRFNLYGVSGRKRHGPISTEATTASAPQEEEPTAALAQPRLGELSASDITHDSVRLSWTVPQGQFDSFTIQYKDVEGKTQALPVDGGSHTATVPNLAPARRYKFNLYGVSGKKRHGPISTEATTASAPQEEEEEGPTVAPAQPSLGELSASDITHDSVRLSWTVPQGHFDSFSIQYRDTEGKTQALPVDGGSRTVTIPNLVPSQRYKFNLYGVSGRKRHGPISTEATTVSAPQEEEEEEPTVAPAQPRLGELSASDITHDSVRLSWTVPQGQFDSFTVQYKDVEGKPQALPVDGGSQTVTVPSLVPARRYKFNLYGVSGRKRHGPISTEATTASAPQEEEEEEEPTAAPAQPRLGQLSASDITHDSVRLSWTVPQGQFDSFTVQYKDADGKIQALPVDGGSHTVTIPSLAPAQQYKFNLYGVSGEKRHGPISTEATTASALQEEDVEEPTVTPAQPSLGELSSSDVTYDSVRLIWTVPQGQFDSFTVQYKDVDGKTRTLPTDGGSRTVTVPNLVPSRRYKFNLYGVSGRKRHGPISTETTTASATQGKEEEEPTAAPAQPHLGELSVSSITHDSVCLSWTVPQGQFDSFTVQYKDIGGKTQALPVDGGSRTVTIPNLVPSQRYKFNLYSVWGRKRHGPISLEATTASAPQEEEEEEEAPTAAPAQPSLGELSASDITHDSVRLSWTVPQGQFDSFTVQYKDAKGKPQALPVDGGPHTVTIPNLVPSQRYKFNLYGVFKKKRHGPISTEITTASLPQEEEEEEPTAAPAQPRLGELTASDITHDSVCLSWTVPQGPFDSFTVQYKDVKGKTQVLPVDGSLRTVTAPNLTPARRYKFNLYGVSGKKRHGPISTEATTASAPQEEEEEPTAAPAQPRLGELSASDITHDSVRLSWTVPQGQFDSFTVQYKDVEGKTQALPTDGGTHTVTILNLVPSQRYIFNLYGVSGRKRHGPISTYAITASAPQEEEKEGPTVAPAQPSLGELSASDVTHDSVRLSWTVPQGEFDSFTVQYKDIEGKPQALPVGGGSRMVTIPGLAPSHRYRFNLYGISGQKRQGPVFTSTITAAAPQEKEEEEPTVAPAQPSLGELSASDVTHESIRISWTVPRGEFDSFIIQYKDVKGKLQALPVDGTSRTAIVPSLVSSQRYKFHLYGVSGGRRHGPISTDAITASGPEAEEVQAQPSLGELSVSDVTPDSLRLSWTIQAGNFNSFLVQYKDADGQSQTMTVDGGSRMVTVSSLLPSRRYKFNIYGISGRKRLGPISTSAATASDQEEEEEEEEEGEREPTSAPAQPSLGELSASDVTHNSVHLAWTVPHGDFDSFMVQYKDAEEKPQSLPVDGGTHTVTILNLTPSHRYKFHLYGTSGQKRLGPISTDAVTAPAPQKEKEESTVAPAQPSLGELSASDITHDSVRLSWTVPQGEFDSFSIQYRDTEGKPQAWPVRGGSRTVTIPGLAPSRRYKFNLYGTSGRKRHGPISTEAITAPAPQEKDQTPEQPRLGELSASDITHDSVRLSWTVPQGDFDSFSIQYRDTDGKPQALPLDGGSRTVTVPALVPSHRYKFNLFGVSGHKRHGPVSTNVLTATAPQEEDEEEPTVAPAQPSLGELSASNVTHDSVGLSWTVPEGKFDSFIIQYRDTEGKPQALPVDGRSHTATVPGLVPSQQYKFNLYGISGPKRLGPISTEAVTAPAPQEEEPQVQPTLGELLASNVTHDSIHLSWTISQGEFDSFSIQYKDAEGKPQNLPMDGASRTVTIPNLASSRRYKFNLYGISGQKRYGPISTDAITGPAQEEGPQIQPSLGELLVSDITHDSVHLSWTVTQGEFDSFTVQYKDVEGRPQALPVDRGSRTVTVPGLAPARRYKFHLYGISGRKRHGPVSTDAITDQLPQVEEPPAQPSLGELSASNITHESVRLSWTVPQGEFDSFIVQYKDIEGKSQALPVNGGSRTITIPGLAPSRRYKFHLYGTFGRKRLGPISTDAATVPAPQEKDKTPAQPSLGELSVSDIAHDSVRLSWTVPQGQFDSFTVQYKDAEGKPQALPVDGGSRAIAVPNLVPSRRYKFHLYGIFGRKRHGPVSTDALTASAPQKEEEVVTAAPAQPSLGELSASDIAHDSVRLSWTVPQGAFDSFTVQYKDVEGKPQALPVDGGSRTATIPDLQPSRRYKFNLYGISGQKRHGPVSIDTITASAPQEEEPTAAPAQPRLGELSASGIAHDSVRLSWTVPEGEFDSFIVQYKDAEGKPQALPVAGGAHTLTVPNLVSSRRYKFHLYGVSGQKRLGPISTDAVTAPAPQEKDKMPAQPRLGELLVSDIAHDSVHLSWTVSQGQFDSFTIQYKDAEGKPQALPVDGGSRAIAVPNLVPSRRYKFHLYGIFGRKRHGPVSTDALTVSAPQQEQREATVAPIQPSLGDLSASDITHDSVRLSWTILQGEFDSFIVQYNNAEGKPQTLPVEGTSHTVTVPDLAPSHRYGFQLYGVSGQQHLGPISTDAATASAPQEEEEEEGPTAAPAQPRLGELSASDITHDSVRLSWTVPQGQFDSFTVQYRDTEGKPQALPVDGGSRTATVPGLVPSRRYKFHLYGISGRKHLGPVSTEAITAPSRETDLQPPPVLGKLSASDVTHDSMLLTWTVLEGTFDSFIIHYRDASGKPQALPVDGAHRSFRVPSLAPAQRYKFNLYGTSGRKRIGPISTDANTVPAPREETTAAPAQPSLGELSASDITHDSVRLSWTVPQGEFDSFTIQYKDAKGKPQALPVDGGSREVTVPSLTPSRRYKFHLYGVAGRKRLGPISTEAVTAAIPQGEIMTRLRLGQLATDNITHDSLDLGWTVEEGDFDSFIVHYRDAAGEPQALPVDGAQRSLHVPSLAPSRRYKFNLYGVSGRKRLGPLSTDAVTAQAPREKEPPAQPRLGELSASNITHNSVRLSWTVPQGQFDSFTIQYKDVEGKPQALPLDGGSRTVTVPGLASSRRYKFHLYGISGRKRHGPISTDLVTATARNQEQLVEEEEEKEEEGRQPGPLLGDLAVSEVTKDSVRLSWTVREGTFDSFTVQYEDAEGKLQALPVDAGTLTAVVSDLVPSHRYQFHLYGISGQKRHGPVSTDAVTAFPEARSEPPAQLSQLAVSEMLPTSVRLSWDAPAREFDTFLIQYRDTRPGGRLGPAQEAEVPGGQRSTVLRGLRPSTHYSLTLHGLKGRERAASLNGTARTSSLELDSPRDLRFSDIQETSVGVSWGPPSSHPDRYKVSYQLTDGGEPQSIVLQGTRLETTLRGLAPGSSYEVSVMSMRGFEESEPLIGYVTTAPDGPSDLRAINITDSSAMLSWRPPQAKVDSYALNYGPPQGPAVTERVPGDQTQHPLQGLQVDTEYQVSISGETGSNRSIPASAAFSTGSDAPRNLRAIAVTSRSARLVWTPPHTPPDGYLLVCEGPSGIAQEVPLDAAAASHELQDLDPSSRYRVQVQALRGGTPGAPITTSFTTGRLMYPFPRDCAEELLNGPSQSREVTVYVGGARDQPLRVYCDMDTDGGGWLVFQRRMNGETDFWRDWQDYVQGFGDLSREFWLGNDALHALTSASDYELRVDLRAGAEAAHAIYSHFRVDPPSEHYRLHLGSYHGTAGDAMSYHSGSVFSTRDHDPNRLIISCAVSYRGAWWYHNCHYANLNGMYGNNKDHQGINWYNWKGFEFSIPFTEMKIRPRRS